MESSERVKMLEKQQCRACCVNPCERNTLYESVSDARALLGRYLDFDNARRRHSSLGARTPVPRPHPGRATPAPREAPAPTKRAHQPACDPVIGTETQYQETEPPLPAELMPGRYAVSGTPVTKK